MSDAHIQQSYPRECNCVMCVCFDFTVWLKSCPLVFYALHLCLWVFLLPLSFFILMCLSLSLCVTDIDECGALTQPCSLGFNCINTVGSYTCQRKLICSRGYHTSPDGSRCIGMIEKYVIC